MLEQDGQKSNISIVDSQYHREDIEPRLFMYKTFKRIKYQTGARP